MALSSLQLEAFLTVTKTLNFTKAAEKLFITQSALSQRILNLESELETALFIRSRSGLQLTETALELVRYCQFKNQFEDEFLSNIRGLDAKKIFGAIRIGGFSSFMRSVFLPSVAGIITNNPSLKLTMVVRQVHELYDLLKRNEIDYMIINKDMQRDDIESVFLGFEENILVQKKNYKGPEVYLDHDENDEVTMAYLKKIGKKAKKIQRLYIDDVYGIADAAKLGMGLAVLPAHLIESDKGFEKDLEIVGQRQVLKIPVFLCYYKQPYYTKLHDLLVKNMRSYCEQRFPLK